MDLTVNGNARRLLVTGKYDPSHRGWRIADVFYGLGSLDASYVARLRRMTAWKKKQV